jgi:hypothetical protein
MPSRLRPCRFSTREMEVEGRWDPLHNLVHRVRYQGEKLGQRALRRLGMLPRAVVSRAGAPESEADRIAWIERRNRYSVALQDYSRRLLPYSARSVVFIAQDPVPQRRTTPSSDGVRSWGLLHVWKLYLAIMECLSVRRTSNGSPLNS